MESPKNRSLAAGGAPRTGVVTIVFTDLVGSTALKQKLGDRLAAEKIQVHHRLVRELLAHFSDGEEIGTAGDSFLIIFRRPSDAVHFGLCLQASLRQISHGQDFPILDRVGIHMGEVILENPDLISGKKDLGGIQVDLCSRVMSLAQGGQILMTKAVFDNARQMLKGAGGLSQNKTVGTSVASANGMQPTMLDFLEGNSLKLTWLNHGLYMLKGLDEPVEVCEVYETDHHKTTPPTNSEKAQRFLTESEEEVLGWRPAVGQLVPETPWILDEKLGEGGFGEVWKAWHPKMKEARVFKFCFRADRVRALKREVTLLGIVKKRMGEHPHIVRLHDVYFDKPPYYIEMDYVSGKDLHHWCLTQGGLGKIPLEEKLEIIAQAADALQAAHDAGVIHRDVKPGNILVVPASLNRQACAKLTDFGIGQVVSEKYLAGVTKEGFTQTILADGSSSKSGTQLYTAPELLVGQPASIRSDIYALGVVLFQMILENFSQPVTMDWAEQIQDPLLREDLTLCFAGNQNRRFAGATQLAERLRQLPERRREQSRQELLVKAREQAAYRRGILRTAGLAIITALAFAWLSLVAWQKARQEAKQRLLVEEKELNLRHHLYAADTRLVQMALADGDIVRGRDLLKVHSPAAGQQDVRGWEWNYLNQACRGDMSATLEEGEFALSLAYSPDQRYLMAVRPPPIPLRLWDIGQRRVVREFANTNQAASVAFSPDGLWILVAYIDHVELWDVSTWQKKQHWHESRNPVCFSPDGRLAVSDSGDGIILRDAYDWRHLLTLTNLHLVRAYEIWGNTIAFSESGELIAMAILSKNESRVCVWRTASLMQDGLNAKPLLNQQIPAQKFLMAIALSPNGNYLACGYFFEGLSCWNVATGAGSAMVTNVVVSSLSLQFLRDGQTLVTASRDRNLYLWKVAQDASVINICKLPGHAGEIWSLALSTNRLELASGDKRGQIHLWEIDRLAQSIPQQKVKPFSVRGVIPWGAMFSQESDRLFACQDGKGVIAYQLPKILSGGSLLTPSEETSTTIGILSTHDLLIQMQEGKIQLAHLKNRNKAITLDGHVRPVNMMVVNSAETVLATATIMGYKNDGTVIAHSPEIRLWDLPQGKLKGKITVIGQLLSVAMSQDGKLLAAGIENSVELWDIMTSKRLATWNAHKVGVTCLGFSADGKRLASGSYDNQIKIWDVSTGHLELILEGHSSAVTSCCFSPDGKTVVTGCLDHSLRFWSSKTGRELCRFPFDNLISHVIFSPNGRYLALAESHIDSPDGLIYVYDAGTVWGKFQSTTQ